MDSAVILVLVSLIFSGFFSAVEIAFISANRLHIEIQSKQQVMSGLVLSKFVRNTSRFIATTLLGNTVALVIYGYYFAELLEPSIQAVLADWFPALQEGTLLTLVLILQTILSTILVLATAEFLPKSLSLMNPDKFLSFASIPMNIIYIAASPFVLVIVFLSRLFTTRVLGLEYKEDRPAFGLTDLNHYIQNLRKSQENTRGEDDRQPEVDTEIFNNALEFKTIRVRDCMIPRKEIIAVEDTDGIDVLSETFTRSGHSKIPVYRDSIDNIIGYCHHLALFKKPREIKHILNEIIIVPETTLANELMIRFIDEQKSIALVVDEFGGTSGIVTIEDIMEEIFGEIEDEYDKQRVKVQKLDDHNYLLSARNEIDFLNEEYRLGLPEGDYDTLGGYILYINQDIPQISDTITDGHFKFYIKSMDNARIDMVQMTILSQQESS